MDRPASFAAPSGLASVRRPGADPRAVSRRHSLSLNAVPTSAARIGCRGRRFRAASTPEAVPRPPRHRFPLPVVRAAASSADLYVPKLVDGEERKPLVGFLPKFAQDPPGFLLKAVTEAPLDAPVLLDLGPIQLTLIQDAEAVAHVLAPGAQYGKSAVLREGLAPLVGEGLVVAEGDTWRAHRRIVSGAFQPQQLEAFVDRFARACEALCTSTLDAECDAPAAKGAAPRYTDAAEWAAQLTFAIVSGALFSLDMATEEGGRFLAASSVAQEFIVNSRIRTPVKLPLWLPLPRHAAFKRAIATIDGLIGSVIEARRARRAAGPSAEATDFLDTLLSAQDPETGTVLSDKELRDEIATLMLGGYETTTAALTWCLYYVSTRPDVAERVRGEVLAAVGPEARPAAADLPRMPYTACVVKEALRLRPRPSSSTASPSCPPDCQSSRPPQKLSQPRPQADDLVGGYRVRAGEALAISPLLLHRSPLYWEDPEAFEPARFEQRGPASSSGSLPASTPARALPPPLRVHALRWRPPLVPVSNTPISNTVPQMELHVLLAMLVRRYRFSPRPDYAEAGWDSSGGIALFPRARSLPLRITRAP
eukprot:tig00020830_g14515.t1